MTFQSDVEKAAEAMANSYEEPIGQTVYESFVRGAQYGRERGFAEAVEMLRGGFALAHDYEHFIKTDRSLNFNDWADWLEKKGEEMGK